LRAITFDFLGVYPIKFFERTIMKDSFLKFFLKNQNGISVVQVIIASGMVSVVGLGIIQTMKTSTKMTKKAAQDFEVNRIMSKMESVLRDSSVCKSTFFGLSPIGLGTNYAGSTQDIKLIALKDNIDTINTWEGATSDIDINEHNSFLSLPIRRIARKLEHLQVILNRHSVLLAGEVLQ
jgi:hypothetical protein